MSIKGRSKWDRIKLGLGLDTEFDMNFCRRCDGKGWLEAPHGNSEMEWIECPECQK